MEKGCAERFKLSPVTPMDAETSLNAAYSNLGEHAALHNRIGGILRLRRRKGTPSGGLSSAG
jgi:hypothetical protein